MFVGTIRWAEILHRSVSIVRFRWIITQFNFQLISNIFKLLDALNAWDDSLEGGSEWAEVLQITERILYHSFMIKVDKEVLVEANKRLSRLLQKRVVTDENEATYQMFKLDTVLRISQAHGTQLLYK